ncbi:hypothetical protein RGQ15_10035 [Paracoccus sp. MBLB3053]|uniref:Uncharacterized protein n=1 Tax=Paracoccus aurantius TaxID=3073814 RepID=A0ABU2HS70_9RHOB|nr:hypothetical protein [Paracoccus sp. MBLB3053]MDS9467905.1 hypothetical protein [Paracoccus sp. MBLB3053]
MTGLGSSVTLDRPFDAAVEAVTAALSAEGFGMTARIDLDRAFAEKLGPDFRRYAVEQSPGGCLVRIADAGAMMGIGNLGESPEIATLATDAAARLIRVTMPLQGATKG